MGTPTNEERLKEMLEEHARNVVSRHLGVGRTISKERLDAVVGLLTMLITLCGDMVRITCIVHMRMEDHNRIAEEIIEHNLHTFLNKALERIFTDFPAVMREYVLFCRDETERKLGVRT